MIRHSLKIWPLIVMASLSVGGCQNLTPPGQSAPDSSTAMQSAQADRVLEREALLQQRDAFVVNAGLGVWTDEETLSARIAWRQTADRLSLVLTGPLGMGTMQLEDEAGLATLTRGATLVAQGPVADRVLQQGLQLTTPIPMKEIAFWIRGLPGAGTELVRNERGELASLKYNDSQGVRWRALFRRYIDWDGVQMPELITATGGPYNVRLLLKDWGYAVTNAVPDTPKLHNRLPIPGR